MLSNHGPYSPLFEDAVCEWSYLFITFLMVMGENDGIHDDAALFRKTIMAVTCHLGWEREAGNGRGRTERGRKKQWVSGCIKAIRDAGLRWQPPAQVEKRSRRRDEERDSSVK